MKGTDTHNYMHSYDTQARTLKWKKLLHHQLPKITIVIIWAYNNVPYSCINAAHE
jgi:hypothetical protein